jgi:hypothetical protein
VVVFLQSQIVFNITINAVNHLFNLRYSLDVIKFSVSDY